MKIKILLYKPILAILSLSLAGCLVTRQEVRDTVKNEPLTPEQQSKINTDSKYQEVEELSRQLLGRVETLENSQHLLSADKNTVKTESAAEKKALQEKLSIYEESISKLEAQVASLNLKVEALQTDSAEKAKPASGKNTFEVATGEFEKKHWKDAISAFDKYRTTNPTGKHYGEATFKIGASFHELGMKTEAKSFYSEVIEKFPKSDWAKKSKIRLKTLK
jgi:TolA-binding protein